MPVPHSLIERLLAEDGNGTDLTTEALGIGALQGRMEFRARSAMTLAGIDIAAELVSHAGGKASVLVPGGGQAKAGELLLTASGPAAALHSSWKVAQTLTEILSGIATATRELVDAVEAVRPDVKVACSRKAVPLTRHLSMMAIRAGGAIPHRLGLSETILVFHEHRVFLPDSSLKELEARLRREAPEKKRGIEVATVSEAFKAIEAGFEIVQLEKMLPAQVSEIAQFARAHPGGTLIAAAGGITPDNAGAYVKAGAGLIVSSWPYTAKPAEISVALARTG
ncbi:MAG: ModD protein [Rhodomicrobium sp.]